MRLRALLPLLLTCACASNDGIIDERLFDCQPGQDVTIEAGFADPRNTARLEGVDTPHTAMVLVGNNSGGDIIVKTIHVEQIPDDAVRYRLDQGWARVDQVVPEGEDGEFKIQMMGRWIRPEADVDPARRNRPLRLRVLVALANGDQYRCVFSIAVPDP